MILKMGIKAPGRKRSRRLHRKISGRKIGYKLHYGLTEDYFKLTGVSDLLCGYARSPRVDSKLASGMARIYCLCQHSPHGRYDSDGYFP